LVSLIGEKEETFAKLTVSHPEILLTVCGNDMDYAYEKWMIMLGAMEDYAEAVGYDIKGLKAYMYVFWNADGKIAHLSFFPKTSSSNIPIAELRSFFQGFVGTYQMQINAKAGFSHYGSAAFPTDARPEYKVRRND
ncbi:MAG: hypothetical protein R3330_11110, partial [Saprospiraceae bacterium]|nr:hypothetical protein [Saprospiraceae bacterium]